jgi:Predicted membrane protein
MSDLFQLSAPWWHFVLRALAIYALVMVLVRVSGKRAVGQFTPFDLVLLILIGNAVQNGINGGDNSLTGAFVMATTLIVLNYIVAFTSSRNRRIERLVEGVPVVLAHDGKLFERVLREQLVSHADFHKALREHDMVDVSGVALALLETDGSISVLPRNRDGDRLATHYLDYLAGDARRAGADGLPPRHE